MRIGYSDLPLLWKSPDSNIDILADNRAETVELFMDGPCWGDNIMEWKNELKFRAEESGVLLSLHPPTVNMDLSCDSIYLRLFAINEHIKIIQLASELKAEYVVIHPGFCCHPVCRRGEAKERSLDSLERLITVAGELEVKLAVENVGSNGSSDLFTLEEYLEFLGQLNSDTVVSLLDVGHAFLNRWPLGEAIKRLGTRLYSLHLHDNDGIKDRHLPLGKGILPWGEVWDSIRQAGGVKHLILEYAPGNSMGDLIKGRQLVKREMSISFVEIV